MTGLQSQRALVKGHVRKHVERTITDQLSFSSEIFGKRIKPEIFDKDRKTLRKTAEKLVDSAFDMFGVDWNRLSSTEQRPASVEAQMEQTASFDYVLGAGLQRLSRTLQD